MSQQQLDYGTAQKRSGVIPAAKRFLRRWWPLLAVLVSLFLFAFWEVFGLHVDEPSGDSPPSVVTEYTGFAPPASATHIHTASFHEGMEFSNYVRFEAPVTDCLAFAQKISRATPLSKSQLPPDPTNVDRKYFSNLSWFDLSSATDLVGSEPGPEVWVDQSRGVFYFYTGF